MGTGLSKVIGPESGFSAEGQRNERKSERYIFKAIDFTLRGRDLGVGSELASGRKGCNAGIGDWEGSELSRSLDNQGPFGLQEYRGCNAWS